MVAGMKESGEKRRKKDKTLSGRIPLRSRFGFILPLGQACSGWWISLKQCTKLFASKVDFKPGGIVTDSTST